MSLENYLTEKITDCFRVEFGYTSKRKNIKGCWAMSINLANRITAITCCFFLIGCEQNVSDPWPELLTKSVDDINVCLDTEDVLPMKFEYPKLIVYSKLIYDAESSVDITSVLLDGDLRVPSQGFNVVTLKCKNGENCVSSKNLTGGYDAPSRQSLIISNWKTDCSMIDFMNANRGIYNLVEYSILKDKKVEPVQ